jgi:tetratricopeptide (TPR) repeat protein
MPANVGRSNGSDKLKPLRTMVIDVCSRMVLGFSIYLEKPSAFTVGICYHRLESLCSLLSRPMLLHTALMGQWRYSLVTEKVTATMQIAKQIYSLAQGQNDSALIIEACGALASPLYFLGDFEAARQHARRGVQIWRAEGLQSQVGEAWHAVGCLFLEALLDWHFGEISSCQPTMAEAISLAKELNDKNSLAIALYFACNLAANERNPAEVDRLASDLIELSMRHDFAHWLPLANIYRGWARCASGDTAEGIPWIEQGIRDYRATGAVLALPSLLAQKAQALYLANRTSEALEAISEAVAIAERFEHGYCSAELHRLRGVFLTGLGADEAQIEASFRTAIKIAQQQKSVSSAKRAEATYGEYRRQKASGSAGRGFRLPLW